MPVAGGFITPPSIAETAGEPQTVATGSHRPSRQLRMVWRLRRWRAQTVDLRRPADRDRHDVADREPHRADAPPRSPRGLEARAQAAQPPAAAGQRGAPDVVEVVGRQQQAAAAPRPRAPHFPGQDGARIRRAQTAAGQRAIAAVLLQHEGAEAGRHAPAIADEWPAIDRAVGKAAKDRSGSHLDALAGQDVMRAPRPGCAAIGRAVPAVVAVERTDAPAHPLAAPVPRRAWVPVVAARAVRQREGVFAPPRERIAEGRLTTLRHGTPCGRNGALAAPGQAGLTAGAGIEVGSASVN